MSILCGLYNTELKIAMHYRRVSVIERMRTIVKERGGFLALYRGILPGTIRSFLANGTSMVVMSYAQRKVTELGLRDK